PDGRTGGTLGRACAARRGRHHGGPGGERGAHGPCCSPMSSEVPCDGPCNSRYRKARAEYEKALAGYDPLDPDQARPAAPEVYPVYGDPWCPRCKSQIHEMLSQLDDLACLLNAMPPSVNARNDDKAGKVSGSKDVPSPSRRMDDLEELGEWLRSWESIFRPV